MKVRITLDFSDLDRMLIGRGEPAGRAAILRFIAASLETGLESRRSAEEGRPPSKTYWVQGWQRWVRGYDAPDAMRRPALYAGWRAAEYDNEQGGGERPKLAEAADAYDDAYSDHPRHKRNPRSAWDLGPLLAVEYIRPDEPDTIYKHQFAGRGLTPDPGFERPTLRVDGDALYVVGGSYHVDPDLGIVDDQE